LSSLYASAFRHGITQHVEELGGLDLMLAEIDRDIAAAHGGDADAAQKAKRDLLAVDARLERLEEEARFPELEEQAFEVMSWAARCVALYGSPQDQRLLEEIAAGLEQARAAKQKTELQRRIHQARQLGSAAYFKDPNAWNREFENAASMMDSCRDLPAAGKLVEQGRDAIAKKDTETVRSCTQRLWELMPVDTRTQQRGYQSGLR
jgi:molecular chaperone DnaK